MMTDAERQMFNARLGELMHLALVKIRNFTFPIDAESPRREEINDLADSLHNLPRYVVGHDEYAVASPERFRQAVIEHVRRFYPDIDPASHRYVQLLDMEEKVFLRHYRDHQWDDLASLNEPLSQKLLVAE